MQTTDVYALLKESKRLLTFEEVRSILHISAAPCGAGSPTTNSNSSGWAASCASIPPLLQRHCGIGKADTETHPTDLRLCGSLAK